MIVTVIPLIRNYNSSAVARSIIFVHNNEGIEAYLKTVMLLESLVKGHILPDFFQGRKMLHPKKSNTV